MTWLYRTKDIHECKKPALDDKQAEDITPGDIWACEELNRSTQIFCNRVYLVTEDPRDGGRSWEEITRDKADALIEERLNRGGA